MASNGNTKKKTPRQKVTKIQPKSLQLQQNISKVDNKQPVKDNSNPQEKQGVFLKQHSGEHFELRQNLIHQQQQTEQKQSLQQQYQQQQQQQQQLLSFSKGTFNSPKPFVQNTVIETSSLNSISERDANVCGIQEKAMATPHDNRMPLHTAVLWRRHDMVETLLKRGARPWAKDQQGNTAFLTACKVGGVQLMTILWDAAASKLDIQHANKDGNTALHLCAESGYKEGCSFLLSRDAGVDAANKTGDTALHLAALGDHASVCHVILNYVMASSHDDLGKYDCILRENNSKQTPICVSIIQQHTQVTRILLGFLPIQKQSDYLTNRLQLMSTENKQNTGFSKLGSVGDVSQNVFLHGLLVSVSVILIRLAERRRLKRAQMDCVSAAFENVGLDHNLKTSDIIQSLVKIACNFQNSQQIVPIACFLIIYLINDVPGQATDDKVTPGSCFNASDVIASNKRQLTGNIFLQSFLLCRGPERLLMNLNESEVTDPNNTMVTIATAAPIFSLIRSAVGRSWLESNKCHLTFLKELILQNRSVITLLTSACPLLHSSYLESICLEFVRLVEAHEARDREQNLVELLWEEERDRMRRERRKHKRSQKKNPEIRDVNEDTASLPSQDREMSSEEETGASADNAKTNEPGEEESRKLLTSLETNRDDMFCNRSFLSKDWFNNGKLSHDIPLDLSIDASDGCAKQPSKTQNILQALNMRSKELSVLKTEITSELTGNFKLNDGDRKVLCKEKLSQKREASDQEQTKCMSTFSKVKRWADIARIGYRSSDNDLGYLDVSDDQSRISSDLKGTIDEQPMPCCLDSNQTFKLGDKCGYERRLQQFNQTLIDSAWCDDDSDQESTSSSSSAFDSRSSLVSDSVSNTYNQKRMPTTDPNVKQEVVTNVCKKIISDAHNSPSTESCKRHRKSKTKTYQSLLDKKLFPQDMIEIGSGQSSNASKVSSNVLLPWNESHGDDMVKTSSKPSGMNCLRFKTRSNENLNDSSWLLVEGNRTFCSKNGLKDVGLSKMANETTDPWPDVMPPSFRLEALSSLPPLKSNESNNDRTMKCAFSKAVSSNGEVLGLDIESSDSAVKRACTNRSSLLKNVSVSSKMESSSHNEQDLYASTTFGAESRKVFIPHDNLQAWSDQSMPIKMSNFSMPPFPGQTSQNTLSQAAFQTFKRLWTDTDRPNYDNQVGDETKHQNSRQRAVSSLNKGKVIATVLLDKVKNPPPSLQQTLIPPLSALTSWTCEEKSNFAWSNLLLPKTAMAEHAAVSELRENQCILKANINKFVELDTQFKNSNSDTSIYSAPSENDRNIERNIIEKNTTRGFSSDTTSKNQSSNFSSILKSRLQQRRQIQDSSSNGSDIVGEIGFNTSIQGIKHIRTLSTSEQHNRQIKSAHETTMATKIPGVTKKNVHEQTRHQHNIDQHIIKQELSNIQQIRSKQDGCLISQAFKITGNLDGSFAAIARERGKRGTEGQRSLKSCHNENSHRPLSHQSDCRSSSPPIFFPERIRDDSTSATKNKSSATFPAFHDVQTSDFLSEMFSDPLFSDKIAISQIRQKIISNQGNSNIHPTCPMQVSDLSDIDLDYYASLYQMKFRDVLGLSSVQSKSSFTLDREANTINCQDAKLANPTKDGHGSQNKNSVFGAASFASSNYSELCQARSHCSRWHSSLQKILDISWTMRRQSGNIVLPNSSSAFSIGIGENSVVRLGFLMDGTEVAVFVLDKARARIEPRMVEIMSDTDLDKHFLAHCKSFSESASTQYLAVSLYEYTLCEYLHLCLSACNQSADVYTGLVWQVLQALSFLHRGIREPHGHLAPCWVFIDSKGRLRLAGFSIATRANDYSSKRHNAVDIENHQHHSTEQGANASDFSKRRWAKPSFSSDIYAAGLLVCFVLTKGQHLLGAAPVEAEMNLVRDRIGHEAFDLVSPMLAADPSVRPTIDLCLKHPMFWSAEKKFRLILIVGSDVLTEMKTGVALTGNGAPTMMEILSQVDINFVSPNWIHVVNSTILKEMRSFRVYKNNLAELTLFVYNCCLHFDKLSNVAKEVLDDPCKYFQNLFPSLFMAIYRSLKGSDRTDRTCYKPFF